MLPEISFSWVDFWSDSKNHLSMSPCYIVVACCRNHKKLVSNFDQNLSLASSSGGWWLWWSSWRTAILSVVSPMPSKALLFGCHWLFTVIFLPNCVRRCEEQQRRRTSMWLDWTSGIPLNHCSNFRNGRSTFYTFSTSSRITVQVFVNKETEILKDWSYHIQNF